MNRNHVVGALALLVLWGLAAAIRWAHVDEVTLGSDAIGQFLGAWTVLHGGKPVPPNPEAGHSLWVGGLLPVMLAGSLRELFVLRFAVGALVAPLGAWTAAQFADGYRKWVAGALAGLILAWDPGLTDTLVVSFRGYGAPEWIAAALAAAAAGGRRGAIGSALCLVGATGQHPMSAGVVVVTAMGVWFHLREHRRWFAVALVAAAVPRVLWLADLGNCGAGMLVCLSHVATGSAEPDVGVFAMVRRALWDRFVVDLGWGGAALLGLGGLLACTERRTRPLALFTLLAMFGVFALGLTIQGLRPYHFRAWMPLMAVTAGLGFSVRAWTPLLAVGTVLLLPVRWTLPPGPQGEVQRVDALAQSLRHSESPVRVEAVWFGDPVGVEPGALVLAAMQAGWSVEPASWEDGQPVVVLVNLDEAGEGRMWTDAVLSREQAMPARIDAPAKALWPDVRVLRFPTLHAAECAVLDAHPVAVGGSFDWLKAMAPGAPARGWSVPVSCAE